MSKCIYGECDDFEACHTADNDGFSSIAELKWQLDSADNNIARLRTLAQRQYELRGKYEGLYNRASADNARLRGTLEFIRDNIGCDRITGTSNPTTELMRKHANIALEGKVAP